MTAPAQQQAVVDPDIPAAVQRRKPVALTQIAAESTKGAEMRDGLTQPGASGKTTINEGLARVNASRKAGAKAKKAKATAVAVMGGNPLAGLSAAKIQAIRGRSYPKAPAMDPMLGDHTPAFVNWLFKNQPKDAAVRYAYRDIYPTE